MKKKITYVMLMILVISYLLLSNALVASLTKNSFQKKNGDISSIATRPVIYAIDKVNDEDQSLFERVLFIGWALFQDHIPGETYDLGIALCGSGGDLYFFSAPSNYIRRDIDAIAGDTGYHGFELSISTILLPSDIYSVYMYCGTEDKNQGVAQTDYVLEKNGKNVSVYTSKSKEVDIAKEILGVPVVEDAVTCIDTEMVDSKGKATIEGWAYIPEHNASDQKVYVLLNYDNGTSQVYDTKKIARSDVAEAYSNDLYTMSGFSATISAEKLKSEKFEVALLIKDKEGIHTTTNMLDLVLADLSTASK